MKKLITVFIFILSISAFSQQDVLPEDQFYNDLLEKHETSGHMNKADLRREKFNLSNDKHWQRKFSKQVRGVASMVRAPRDIIKLQNPTIVIPVK